MTIKQYLNDATLTGRVRVALVTGGDRPSLRLAETWFHPQGGGQKSDRGRIGSVIVTHVSHNNGEVDHIVASLDGIAEGDEVEFAIDAGWRRTNSIYHSAGHLLASVAERAYSGLRAVSGHQWPGEARVEFEGGPDIDMEALRERVDAELRAAVAAALPVQILGDPFASRAIAMGDFPPIPCGGTHVGNTKDISSVQITSAKRKGERIRLSYALIE